MTIDIDSLVARSDETVSSDLETEVVILDLASSAYVGLDGVGARVWELLERPIRLSDLEERLLAEYDVDRSVLRDDLIGLLGDLRDRGLIDVADPTS